MANEEVRTAVLRKGMKFWELADALKITDGTLSRWLRHEFNPEKKAEIMAIIEAYPNKTDI